MVRGRLQMLLGQLANWRAKMIFLNYLEAVEGFSQIKITVLVFQERL